MFSIPIHTPDDNIFYNIMSLRILCFVEMMILYLDEESGNVIGAEVVKSVPILSYNKREIPG